MIPNSPQPPRRSGLARTFEVLAATSDQATDVLLPSLDATEPALREGALAALLRRRSLLAEKEILKRLNLPEREARWREIIAQYPGSLAQGMRDAIVGRDRDLCQAACRTAVWMRAYEILPAVLSGLESPNLLSDLLGAALVELAEVLREELESPRDRRRGADPEALRERLVEKLQVDLRRVAQSKRAEVIEAFLILVNEDNPTLRELLDDPHDSAYLPLVQVLTHSHRTAVVELILSCLSDTQAPTTMLAAVANRGDADFLSRLVKRIGSGPLGILAAQLRRMDSLAWARGDLRVYEALDGAGQVTAIRILMSSGMNRLEAFRSIEYLLLRGKPAARVAAAQALAEFNGSEANQLALRALSDRDPAIVAAVARQLRSKGIPGALPKLIDLLDSTHSNVREAAREALGEFSFARFIATYDALGEDARRSTGAMVRKIDPRTDELLVEEMKSGSRSRRLRAVSAASAIEAVAKVGGTMVDLLRDEDHLVRLEAARALGQWPSDEARRGLTAALADRSALVQDAARRSLEEIEQAGFVSTSGARLTETGT